MTSTFYLAQAWEVQSFPKKDLQGFCLSTTHILPASQNGREAQHARAMDRSLVNLFSEMTVYILQLCTCQA